VISLFIVYAEARIKVLCWSADEDRNDHLYEHLQGRLAEAWANLLNADPHGRFEADFAWQDPTVDVSQYQVILVMDFRDRSGTAEPIASQLGDLWYDRRIGCLVINEGIRQTFWEFTGLTDDAGADREAGTFSVAPPAGCTHEVIAGIEPFEVTIRDWYLDVEEFFQEGIEVVLEREDGLPVAWVYEAVDNPGQKGAFFGPGDAQDPIFINTDPNIVRFFWNTVEWLLPPMATEGVAQAEVASVVSYPNPVNPECYIPLPEVKSQNIQVKIYNILGQLVRKLECSKVQTLEKTGLYWDGRDNFGLEVPAGMYFYEIAGQGLRRMVVLR
jgi:hypothetical protein